MSGTWRCMNGMGCPSPLSSVVVFDDAAQAVAGRGEVVFEFVDASLGVFGSGGVGVAFGEELAGGRFQAGDTDDEFGSVWCVDLGAELQA